MARLAVLATVADRRLLRQHWIGHEGDEDQNRDDGDERVTGDPVKTARCRLGQIWMCMADHGTLPFAPGNRQHACFQYPFASRRNDLDQMRQ